MSDKHSTSREIPHFDATERRREKMPRPMARRPDKEQTAQPQSQPRRPRNRPLVSARPRRAEPRIAPATAAVKPAAVSMHVPAKPSPAPAKHLPATPVGADGNGASNDSTSHHPTESIAPALITTAAHRQAGNSQNRVSDAAAQQAVSPVSSAAELEAFLINFVVEQTGYPAEVVDLDADLEADLGIDSIKKAQLFGELQEYFDVGAVTGNAAGAGFSLDDFTTLRHVLNFLVKSTPAASSARP